MVLSRPRSGEALVEAARELAPTIEARADQIERDRRLPTELVDALIDADLFRMLLPRSLGGAELELPTFVRVIEQLARADGSVAWCVGQANGLFNYLVYLDPAAARRMFADGRTIVANGPGQGNRPGRALACDGGFRVSGRWMFASGIGHATWLLAICHLFDASGAPRCDANGSQALRLLLLPKSAASIHDVWHVSGLRGTGSQAFSADDVFVPREHVISIVPEERHEPGPLYLFNTNAFFGPAFGSVALGLAHASLAAIVDLAAGKVPRGMERPIRESATVQASIAQAYARLGAARSYLHQTLREVWEAVVASGELSVEQRVHVRLASTHATQEAVAVVDAAYALAGSNAIFASQPFERRFRDVHAVSQQFQARRAHYEAVGAYLVGLEPKVANW